MERVTQQAPGSLRGPDVTTPITTARTTTAPTDGPPTPPTKVKVGHEAIAQIRHTARTTKGSGAPWLDLDQARLVVPELVPDVPGEIVAAQIAYRPRIYKSAAHFGHGARTSCHALHNQHNINK